MVGSRLKEVDNLLLTLNLWSATIFRKGRDMPRNIDKIRDIIAHQLVIEKKLTYRSAREEMRKLGIKAGVTTLKDAVKRVKENPKQYEGIDKIVGRLSTKK